MKNSQTRVDSSNVHVLVDEYESYASEVKTSCPHGRLEFDWTRLVQLLIQSGDWTAPSAAALIGLTKQYGVFMLRNALALAIALGIEDGELGY